MSLIDIRRAFWSDICAVDSVAYSKFLQACLSYGCRIDQTGGGCGTAGYLRDGRCGVDACYRHESPSHKLLHASAGQFVDVSVVSDSTLDSKDLRDNSFGKQGDCHSDIGVTGGSLGDSFGRPVGNRGVCDCSVEDRWRNSSVDGGAMEVSGGCDSGEVSGGAGVKKGKHYWRNKKRRAKRKVCVDPVPEWRRGATPVASGFFSSCSDAVRSDLRESRASALIAKNRLDAELAARKLSVVKAGDLDQEVRRHRTGVVAATEKNMVSIEKAHSSLSVTDNVPGFARTVSGSSFAGSSISPNSSASVNEFFSTKKKLDDVVCELEDLKSKVKFGEERFGIKILSPEDYDKHTWTDCTDSHEVLDGIYPDGYGLDFSCSPPGKFHVV